MRISIQAAISKTPQMCTLTAQAKRMGPNSFALPFEEVLGTLTDLVRTGKPRYYGLSNVPSWYAVSIATLAKAHGLPSPIA
jgi:aryl-alcohol dehydrogenase-like predicted oxidoreductase